jgi:DNA-binding response OmpR family regulator
MAVKAMESSSVVDRSQVLVVDDDPSLRTLVCELLSDSGLEPTPARDGVDGLRKFFELRPSLVVLDVKMPGMDGIQTLEQIRNMSDVPVLMLTGRASELDTVNGLRSGADDYVCKPFGSEELVARTQALLRRWADNDTEEPKILADGLVMIDFGKASVMVNGSPVVLTPLEFKLLTTFVDHPDHVLGADRLRELVWGDAETSRDEVKVYVGYLRRKLKEAASVEPIETVRGFGYRYCPRAA